MMNTAHLKFAAFLGILTAGLVGCSGNSPGLSGLKSGEADSLNAQNSKFETVKDPDFTAETHFAAGQLAESQNAPRRAIEQYQAALRVNPHHLPSLFRLGVVYTQNQAYVEGADIWRRYVQETNGDATACANLGFCQELAGRLVEAEQAYKAGIAKDGKNNPCRVNYGLMLARAGRTNEAIVQLQAALPEAQVRYNLGSVYEQMGKRAEAKAEYRRAMELDPSLVEAKTRLAGLE